MPRVARVPPELAADWLARARSNFALAGGDRASAVLLEDLCFNAQQAAEKAIKAVCVHYRIPFRFVHNLGELLTTLEHGGVSVPEGVKPAAKLTEYAVETRYPGAYEPVTTADLDEALALARRVLAWAESVLKDSGVNEPAGRYGPRTHRRPHRA
jgi:HEPN domain-containing protein